MDALNNEVLDNFKMTELGPLPEEWGLARLGDVLEEIDVRVRDYNSDDAIQFPVLSLTRNYGLILQSERFDKRIATANVSKYKVIEQGQIVYNPYVIWEGAVHILRKYLYGLVSPVYVTWQVKPGKANPFFVDHLLRVPNTISAYQRYASGVVNRRRAISKANFLSIEIPLPPLSEQHAIARVLSTIQRAIEAQDKIIAAAREVKKSLMRHLFTYGAVPPAEAERVPLKETEIGMVPEGWEVIRLGDLAQVKYGKTNPKSSGNIPVIGSGGIFAWTDKPLVAFPTLVIGRKGTAGEIHLAENPSYPSDTTFYLAWKKQISVPFLFNYLSLHKLSGEHAKTTLPSLQRHELENLVVVLPPDHEQRAIARILSVGDNKIEMEEKREGALQTLFKTMLHQLMTGQVRVPIG